MKANVLITVLGVLLACASGEQPINKAPVSPPVLNHRGASLLESVGIETVGGVFTPLIAKGSDLGASKSQLFSTFADNQNQITLKLYAGTDGLTSNNRALGAYKISGFPTGPRGTPQIEITFTAAKAGTLVVTAKDQKTGKDVTVQRN